MRFALLGVIALALVAVSCSGGDGEAGPAGAGTTEALLLSPGSFEQLVAAKLDSAGLAAEPGGKQTVNVEDGLTSLEVDLAAAYADYEADPSRRDSIVATAVDEARARLQRGLEGESFEDVQSSLMPLLEPEFALRRLRAQPLTTPFVDGLSLVYLVDREDSRMPVTRGDADRWGVSPSRIARVAQENLVGRTEPLLCEEQLCGWASGDGYDATRLTSARLREDIADEIGRAVYAVPRDDVFVAVPAKYANRIRQKVLQQFTQAKRPVSPDVFTQRDGRVVVLPPAR